MRRCYRSRSVRNETFRFHKITMIIMRRDERIRRESSLAASGSKLGKLCGIGVDRRVKEARLNLLKPRFVHLSSLVSKRNVNSARVGCWTDYFYNSICRGYYCTPYNTNPFNSRDSRLVHGSYKSFSGVLYLKEGIAH